MFATLDRLPQDTVENLGRHRLIPFLIAFFVLVLHALGFGPGGINHGLGEDLQGLLLRMLEQFADRPIELLLLWPPADRRWVPVHCSGCFCIGFGGQSLDNPSTLLRTHGVQELVDLR